MKTVKFPSNFTEFMAQQEAARLGNAPVQPEYHAKMVAIMKTLDEFLNEDGEKKTGIVIMVFPYGTADGQRCNYMSNGADRKDIVVLMKEMIARFEGQPEVKGRA